MDDIARWSEIDGRFAALVPDDPPHAAGVPPHEVSPLQGKLLHLLARAIGARQVLELGTLGGYSAIWFARTGARVTTIEIDAERAEIAAATIAAAGHADAVEILVGDALQTLPGLDGPFDLVFIDADKQRNPEYLEHALRVTRPGALIVADNVVRHDMTRFTEQLAADPRVDATAIQTVGVKGHDGFVLALVQDT